MIFFLLLSLVASAMCVATVPAEIDDALIASDAAAPIAGANSTFTVSILSQGSPGCVTLFFSSAADCKKFYLTSKHVNCTYSPQICSSNGVFTICTAQAGGNCTIGVPTSQLGGNGISSGTCFPSALSGPPQSFNTAAISGPSGNPTGAMTFTYPSNAICQNAALTMNVVAGSDACSMSEMCQDASGNPTSNIVVSPLAGQNTMPMSFDSCGVSQFMIVPYLTFTVDYGYTACP
jgi:hypothetical protein